jgi:hypothetical protein
MANAEHDPRDCPYDAADANEQPHARLDRQNHYAHDIGCPFECTDRHNHPIKA